VTNIIKKFENNIYEFSMDPLPDEFDLYIDFELKLIENNKIKNNSENSCPDNNNYNCYDFIQPISGESNNNFIFSNLDKIKLIKKGIKIPIELGYNKNMEYLWVTVGLIISIILFSLGVLVIKFSIIFISQKKNK